MSQKRLTVRTVKVSGSPRHVSKTHGTHNGRVDTWPHASDAIERPCKLKDPVLHHTRFGKQHRRVRTPKTTINEFFYQDGARDLMRRPAWVVTVVANPGQSWKPRELEVVVTAWSEEEAVRLGIDLACCIEACNPTGATARLR